jgi:leucyl/phenylalanyl-tRNA--protein transferase
MSAATLASTTAPVYWIAANVLADRLPDPDAALREPDGLLAAGGDLEPATLLDAYRRGIFPWFSPGEPILWWSPDPRCVLYPERVHVARSLRKRLRRGEFRVSLDTAFSAVLRACAAPRRGTRGTWLGPQMRAAYAQLHRLGYAHSLECWRGAELAGGIYGVGIGQVFFGESMFSRVADASKAALVELCVRLQAWDYRLIDCQVANPHLLSMGAETVPRAEFIAELARWTSRSAGAHAWRTDA